MARKKNSDEVPEVESDVPSSTVRTWVSIWVAVHLVAIAISFTAVVEPSSLHAQLTQVLHPYLRAPHFGADDRPVYLAHGDATEQPHRLQITTATGDPASLQSTNWREIDPLEGQAKPGLASSDRMGRYVATIALLAGNEQPSLVAELLLPIATSNPELTVIRVVRLPTDLNEINTGVETVYLARIVRRGESVSLVQLREARLSSEARPVATEASDE